MRVNSFVKFSYNISKGSVKDREKLVSNLNEQFFNAFVSASERKDRPFKLKNLKKIYNKLLPEKKQVEVKSLKNYNCNFELDGVSSYLHDDTGKVFGITLEVPVDKQGNQKASIVTLMHENTHVLEALTQPKHIAISQKLVATDKCTLARENWYHGELYKEEKIPYYNKIKISERMKKVEHATKKFLKRKNFQDKVDYLNDARYELEEERKAYREQLKYARKLKEMGKQVEEDDLKDCDKIYLFKEKIIVLKKILREVLQKERNAHMEQLKEAKNLTKTGKLELLKEMINTLKNSCEKLCQKKEV